MEQQNRQYCLNLQAGNLRAAFDEREIGASIGPFKRFQYLPNIRSTQVERHPASRAFLLVARFWLPSEKKKTKGGSARRVVERMLVKCWMNGVFKRFQRHSTFSKTNKMLK